jgi:myo-inositol-1(or 4)-monophosphatase
VNPDLEFVESLARQAGDILRQGYGKHQQIDYKGEIDLVTEADRRSEAFLISEIRRRFPTHRIITEESGALAGEADQVWYLDPLDGTVNYAHGVPLFTVSVAYARDGQVLLGAVYDPMRSELYSAERGQGAHLNGGRLQAAQAESLGHSLLVTGFPYDIRTNPANNLDNYAAFSLRSQGVRRLGSAALDLCYLAAGRIDGYWEIRIMSYDIAAGGLIAEEAGATVTNIFGSPDYLAAPVSILAANPQVHAQMLAVLEELHPGNSPRV